MMFAISTLFFLVQALHPETPVLSAVQRESAYSESVGCLDTRSAPSTKKAPRKNPGAL